MQPKLETERLTRFVGDEPIVEDVSLSIPESEVLAIIGPSGAGKSSFLRLLNRLDEPTSGTVYLDGTDYRELDPQELRRRIGLIPQRPALRGGSVYENATTAFRIRDEPTDEERIEQLLEAVDLDGYADREIERLSGGERQRVSIVRTLANEPEVLLLDEPTSSLDSEIQRRIEELLTDLISTYELTCVIVTHDVGQARRLGDRIARFEDGRVTKVGAPRTVAP